jgi:hypothetical protein
MSLAFHIVFAVVGMGMPLLMALSEWRWLRSGEQIDLLLAKRWAKGTAILFAVGAVSGTVLSFELGLLWPRFMSWAGAIIGMPFSLAKVWIKGVEAPRRARITVWSKMPASRSVSAAATLPHACRNSRPTPCW